MPTGLKSDYLVGSVFGDLTVVRRALGESTKNSRWECVCVCGNATIVSRANLRHSTKSCGCRRERLARERAANPTTPKPRQATEKDRERRKNYYWGNADRERENARVYYRERMTIERALWFNARNRAKAKSIPFDLELADIVVPERCPVLGVPLRLNREHAKPDSASIDRIDPSRGYVRGNIAIISHRANSIKNDATPDELRAVLAYMEKHG